jgi:phosphonopyruvate decarboxylase
VSADPSSRAPLDELPSALTDLGYRFATGVPCSTFQQVIEHFSATGAGRYIAAANEGAALSLAGGAAMAGVKSLVLLQNSGLGNLVNPLTSLVTLYEIAVLVLVSVRDAEDGPQHRLMGRSTGPLLRELDVPVFTLSEACGGAAVVLAAAERELAAGPHHLRAGAPGAVRRLGPPASARGPGRRFHARTGHCHHRRLAHRSARGEHHRVHLQGPLRPA